MKDIQLSFDSNHWSRIYNTDIRLSVPFIEDILEECRFNKIDKIKVYPKKGWLLILEK
jgi:hypothetical protein